MLNLLQGRRYRVRFRLQGQRVDRIMVAKYLGVATNGYHWDLRPKAGTLILQKGDMLQLTLTQDEVKTPQKARD